MYSAEICSAKPDSAKPDGPISEARGSRLSRNSYNSSETMTAESNDWRTPLVRYLENSGDIADRKVR
jgi:hypothetical protein